MMARSDRWILKEIPYSHSCLIVLIISIIRLGTMGVAIFNMLSKDLFEMQVPESYDWYLMDMQANEILQK